MYEKIILKIHVKAQEGCGGLAGLKTGILMILAGSPICLALR